MNSWILMHVEDGSACMWDAGGDWWTEGREEYIEQSTDLEIILEEEPEIQKHMEGTDVFRVLLEGVSFVVEEGGWDLDYGYEFPCAHIEYDSLCIVGAEFKVEETQ